MKFSTLRAIGHDIAASLASGASFLTGIYEVDPFREAVQTDHSVIDVDFLTGEVWGSKPGATFPHTVKAFSAALPVLCAKHGVPVSAFKRLQAQYASSTEGDRFVVTVVDTSGRRSVDEYGRWGERLRVLDALGRVRRKRGAVTIP